MRPDKCGSALRIACLALLVAVLAGAPLRAAVADDFDDKVEAALAAPQPADVAALLEAEAYRGNLKAAHQLGVLLREGSAVPRDDAAAYAYFMEAAQPNWIRARYKLGLAEAQYAVATMLRDGIGVDSDMEAAAEWFERAAEQGHGPSQLALASLHVDGRGVKKDDELAYFWSALAARTDGELEVRAATIRKRAGRSLDQAELRALTRKVSAWSASQR